MDALMRESPVASWKSDGGSLTVEALKNETDVGGRIRRLNAAIRQAVRGMRPPERMTVSEWADRNRVLSLSAENGKWRTKRTPYLKEVMDAFTDPNVRNIVLAASSQVGKSECINNMIGYVIDQDPGSILFIHPTVIDAEDYSKLRIAPMIRDCPTLRKKVSKAKSRDSANTIKQKTYPGGILTMCGSTEAHALASKPIRYVFGDERDRWKASAGSEGDPWLLAQARQTTFYNAKSVEVSTPTVKNASPIEKSFAKGTMERWCSRCPHCGEYHEINFADIRFEYDETEIKHEKLYTIRSIWYLCPDCGGVSDENDMKRADAKWIAGNPEAYRSHRTRSFWLNSWVSPWSGWEESIMKFLQARGDSKAMQVVYNTRFGLLWEDRGGLEDEDSLLDRREDYGRNENLEPVELPDGVLLLTMGVDTQDDRMEYEVVGHGHFGETWGIRKGVIMGRPDTDEVWQRLDEAAGHVYRFRSGVGLRVSLTFVDEGGHYTQEVRLRCLQRLRKKFFPIKGYSGDGVPYTAPPKKYTVVIDGKKIADCQVFPVGVDAGKALIMDSLKVRSPGAKYCHFPRRDDYGPAYFRGLLSERLTYSDKRQERWKWEIIPGHERNEPLDCRNYALAAAKALQPDYDALAQRIRRAAGVAAPEGAGSAESGVRRAEMKTARRARPAERYDDW